MKEMVCNGYLVRDEGSVLRAYGFDLRNNRLLEGSGDLVSSL